MKASLTNFLVALIPISGLSFTFHHHSKHYQPNRRACSQAKTFSGTSRFLSSNDDAWSGEVVSNTQDGAIKGCVITQVPGTMTTWTIAIDGVEADLGKFSEAIYRKITADAKQQAFQGFRPGTIPPHLLPTYISFSMDEAAREATLEAMEQNNIRPFEESRSEIEFSDISIPPPKKKKNKKKKKKKKKKTAVDAEQVEAPVQEEKVEDAWLTFATMKEAIDAGWKPGTSFSFVSKNVKGQKKQEGSIPSTKEGYSPIGTGGSAFDMNAIAAQVATDASNDN